MDKNAYSEIHKGEASQMLQARSIKHDARGPQEFRSFILGDIVT